MDYFIKSLLFMIVKEFIASLLYFLIFADIVNNHFLFFYRISELSLVDTESKSYHKALF